MLRLPSLLQAMLIVIVALISCVHGLGVQDSSATSGLVQAEQDTDDALAISAGVEDGVSELSGAGRDLQTFNPHVKFFFVPKKPKKKVIFVPKPKKKVIFVPKPKKKVIFIKPKKKFFIPKKKVVIIKKKKPVFKKKFYKKY